MTYFEELKKKAQEITKPTNQVLAVSGSPRKGGNSDVIMKQILLGLESENIASESTNLGSIDFSGCIGCEKCRKDKICTMLQDGMSVLYPSIMDSRGLVLVSPVHNYNVTSWMKAFIDRLYCFYEFDNNTRPRNWSSNLANQNRKVVIAAICEQDNIEDLGFAIEAMQRPMEALGFEIVGTLPVFNSFEKGAVKKQKEIMDKAFELGVLMGQQLK
ncbi:flavodoxin family protein [Ancylomarina sp. 16SWW S1-10-2]|uniref:flavodoxin family protein n=1 Tax=Ancylomarina sp. 16SWW S1-10-2 TaxID=2499681 RepID=UPI0012AE9DEB|nr:flavodoxin family protein [Ancylomarina sp. 16SWW S1-10-2]MRT93578.1 flavodoxin family protein [Ancylomarina sp. 16SWW S1-10-2]